MNSVDNDIVHRLDFLSSRAFNSQPGTGVPSFKWVQPSVEPFERLLIRFPDNGTEDVALLKRTNPIPLTDDENDVDSCIFQGHLRDEKDVFVSLNGCPRSMTFDVSENKINILASLSNAFKLVLKICKYGIFTFCYSTG